MAGEEYRGGGGADLSPGSRRTSVHTHCVQGQPQFIGVHGSGGVLIELVKCGLGRGVLVSPTPRPLGTLKEAQSGSCSQRA